MVQNITNEAISSSKKNALNRLLDISKPEMERVNSLILSRADSHVEMVPQLAQYLIESGGKRLRPMLTVAVAMMIEDNENKNIDNSVHFAAAVEFMHNATLLHDDVVDESTMRRGKPAARMIWGNQASVLVGDFLLGQAFLMMVETKDLEALKILSTAATIIAEGEVFQLAKTGDLKTSTEDYDLVIRSKTGALFEAATKVGAMAGGANKEQQDALGRYGSELGRVFQLVDDALDYGGIKNILGKNTGDDLREGKMTLPIILALKSATETEKELIVSALGNQTADDKLVEKIILMIKEKTILNQVIGEAEKSANIAKQELAILPNSEIKNILIDIVDFCLLRVY